LLLWPIASSNEEGSDLNVRAPVHRKEERGRRLSRADVAAKDPSLVVCNAKIYPSLIMVRDQGRSIIRPEGTSHMDQSLENRIRERAYEMWTAHGCVHGQAEQQWLAAEREVLATSTALLAGKPVPKKNPRSSERSKIAGTLARAG
jgi:Protein of unknown function (DUF2934)